MKGMFSVVIPLLLCACVCSSQDRHCLVQPTRVRMEMPDSDFILLEEEGPIGLCDPVPDSGWTRAAGNSFDLCVHTEGPSGSGRFWEITVGIARKDEPAPGRGICFTTSTVGWRTLRTFGQSPLQWLGDQDGDAKPELVIWDSFALRDEATTVEFGLVAWVYQVDSLGRCTIDWELSRRKAAELAAAYRRPLREHGNVLEGLRVRAAGALEEFASKECIPEPRSF